MVTDLSSAPAPAALDLPDWAAALPLWLGSRWLWLTVLPNQPIRAWHGSTGVRPQSRVAPNLDFLAESDAYPIIVLDLRGGEAPVGWWPQLAAALAPGGLLLVCGASSTVLAPQLTGSAPDLLPAPAHVITPGPEAYWYLRPATPAFRDWIMLQLQPPNGVRSWLVQLGRRWVPPSRQVPCLPVWRARSDQDLPFHGALSPELLALVAGQALPSSLSLLHIGQPGADPNKRLLFLLDGRAGAPFALIKWAQGPAAQRLLAEQRALAQIQDLGDPLLAASSPPSWGPFVTGSGALVTIERYLAARAMHVQLRTSLWPQGIAAMHFRRLTTWLVRFAQATRQATRPLDDALLTEYITGPLRLAATRFGAAAGPPAAIDAALARATAYLGCPVGLTAEHGDLWLANLLLPPDPDGLYVVDWEHYRPSALPGFDILFFCMSYAGEIPWRPLGWAPAEVVLTRVFVQPTWLQPCVADLLERCCAAAGLPRSLVPVLVPALFARMALRSAASGPHVANNFWLRALRAWWDRPPVTWLESWAARPDPPPPDSPAQN